jgi:hypothetical protein
MQHFILQNLTPHFLLCDLAEKSYNHFNGEGSDFKSCSSPYRKCKANKHAKNSQQKPLFHSVITFIELFISIS